MREIFHQDPDPLLVFGSDPDLYKKNNGSETLLVMISTHFQLSCRQSATTTTTATIATGSTQV